MAGFGLSHYSQIRRFFQEIQIGFSHGQTVSIQAWGESLEPDSCGAFSFLNGDKVPCRATCSPGKGQRHAGKL
jgi:hypothetical protein